MRFKGILAMTGMLFTLLFNSCDSDKKQPAYISDDIYRFYIGDWECTAINDGELQVPVSNFFDSANAQKLLPAIGKYGLDTSSVTISINVLILRNLDHTIVIDPGLGKDVGGNEGRLMESLRLAGIDSSAVDHVIISHGHWDHIGGLATDEGRLNFPNARVTITETEWNYWMSEENLEKMPEFYASWVTENLPPVQEKVMLIRGDEEIVRGITAIPAPGHTPGQIALLISSGSDNLLYIADALHFTFQTDVPEASPVVDMDPDRAVETRKSILEKVKENNYKIFGFHFEFPGIGHFKETDEFRWEFEECVSEDKAAPSKCTVFTLAKGDQVFFGGNDDYIHPDSWYWVDPGDSLRYGVIWVGEADNVQQGINERGLAYDANGLPRFDVNPHNERLAVSGDYTSYPIHIMHECATVEEVVNWVNTHQWHTFMHDQMQFADATGDAVIISAGEDGEVVFTRKPAGDGFLVSTNFNVANPANGFSYPCWRYTRAQEVLDGLVHRKGPLSEADAAGVLEAVHMDGGASWTISSLLADLPNGLVYLYYFHQFDRPVVLNLQEELANPRAPGALSQLFPKDVRQEADLRYEAIQAKARLCQTIGIIWLAGVLVSLILLLALPANRPRKLQFWIPATIILGPPALIIWLATGRREITGPGRSILVEIIGDIMPTSFFFVLILGAIVYFPYLQGSWALQIILVFILPVILGLLAFHGLLLAPASKRSYSAFVIRRLPQVLIVTNLGMAGIIMAALPLINLSIRSCPIMPFSIWTPITWWVILILGSTIGCLLIFIFEYRSVKRGFRAWSLFSQTEEELQIPSWRNLWLWILVSYLVLAAGMAAGIALNNMMTG